MDTKFILAIFLMVAGGIAGLAFWQVKTCCAQGSTIGRESQIQNLSAREFKKWLDAKRPQVFLLDVRTQAEYEEGHIDQPDARIDYREINQHVDQLPQDKNIPILVYCRSGNRSAQAAQTLIDLGYSQVYNLEKGILDWQTQRFSLNQ